MNDAERDATDTNIRLIMSKCSPQELEALTRFYLLGQTPEHIHQNLGFTAGQLTELKARVIADFFAMKKPS
jgi:hypothetical protein